MFVSIGKEKYEAIVESGKIEVAKMLYLGIVADERICDGFYHANAMRLFQKLMKDPTQLEQNLEHIVEDAK
jgi:pyruvate/2-oxoglutarate dehydrogenase complex dihydrolipoamide acyltransferase (E2) component